MDTARSPYRPWANQIVWLKMGSLFKAQQVEAGSVNGNAVQITKGLTATDIIAANAQYLTDSESFIKIKENEN